MSELLKLRDLINCYQYDPHSTYHRLRYHVRVNHDGMLSRLIARHGFVLLEDIKARVILSWYADWTGGGVKIAMGQSFIGQLRTLFSFGTTILENRECERLSLVLSKMRFAMPKSRTERITAAQCVAIRRAAHSFCWPSIALAQALQFDLMLRQKDVLGEIVPISEPGESNVFVPKGKWLRGICWEEIDANLILRHVTSKRGKPIEVDLRLAPMVMEELELYGEHESIGPVIICDTTGLPWVTSEYRRKWRMLANFVGIPREVRNMDSRAGGITEASDAGADMEGIRQAATHSNVSMTQKYNRNAVLKTAEVMRLRAEYRKTVVEFTSAHISQDRSEQEAR